MSFKNILATNPWFVNSHENLKHHQGSYRQHLSSVPPYINCSIGAHNTQANANLTTRAALAHKAEYNLGNLTLSYLIVSVLLGHSGNLVNQILLLFISPSSYRMLF